MKRIFFENELTMRIKKFHTALLVFGNYCRQFLQETYIIKVLGNYPPAQNQYMQEKNLGELIFREYMRGLYSHLCEYRKIVLRSHFLRISQIPEGNYFRGLFHVAPVFAPARIQENIPGELFMYCFRARG